MRSMAGAAGGRWASSLLYKRVGRTALSSIHGARTGTRDARERCTEKRNVSCEISILLRKMCNLSVYCSVFCKLHLRSRMPAGIGERENSEHGFK